MLVFVFYSCLDIRDHALKLCLIGALLSLRLVHLGSIFSFFKKRNTISDTNLILMGYIVAGVLAVLNPLVED